MRRSPRADRTSGSDAGGYWATSHPGSPVCVMAWRWMCVCVGLLLLLVDHPNTKGEAAPTFQPATISASTHTPETDEDYYTSVGHVIALPCDDADGSQNVTWRREAPPLDTAVAGVKVRGGALWFLPADSSHSGIYVCERSDAEPWRVSLRVGSGHRGLVYLKLNQFERLDCGQDHIFRYGANLLITWLKDCTPLNRSERILKFPRVSIDDKGNYTCLLHFSLEEHNYISASATQVSIEVAEQLSKPQVILPGNETRVVELGSRLELTCVASTGGDILLVSWRMNDALIINHTLFTITERMVESRIVKTLIISEVREEHLNIPFQCWAINSLGQDFRQIILQAANQELFYCVVGLVVAFGLLLVCVCLCWRCRVELVLLYRSLCPLHKQYGFSPRFWSVTMVTNSSSEAEMTSQVKVSLGPFKQDTATRLGHSYQIKTKDTATRHIYQIRTKNSYQIRSKVSHISFSLFKLPNPVCHCSIVTLFIYVLTFSLACLCC
ncbi:interleukin-1 receptor accessory protein-like 1-B isoform X1 [Alosa alosa]|uniref:interleukin-1 receptor accessory protein-like 1-B isoform X1 n=1 Tax=Alosa alosa TaxID=278164 RepID=UPI0020150582|nr:interleukin-1 receptor accessory protein-like 1-B isoform X1 [Alosa alosa]XP_048095967.1 interleukin-1 receptor accessory protein-like 1-B isoform X1 [Alosa alosa]